MSENSKKHMIKIIYFIGLFLFIFSCNEKKQYNKELIGTKIITPISRDTISRDTIYIKNKNLIIERNGSPIIYKNLIVNYTSLNTFIELKNSHIFYLIYEYNTSSTKMQHVYKYFYRDSLILVSKEINKLSKEKFVSNRMYFKDFVIKKQEYKDLESLFDNIETNYVSYSKKAKTFLFDYNKQKFGEIINSQTGLEKYLDLASNLKKPTYIIIDVERANNTAYYLEQSGLYQEAIFLLEKIVEKFPDRTVAYLNLGDAYWGNNKKTKAKKMYLIYSAQMKKKNKENIIPKYLFERIKK